MIQQTIDELREMKSSLEKSAKKYDLDTSDIETLNKAIIACEQLRKARKKAKRWKRKYLDMQAVVDERVDYPNVCVKCANKDTELCEWCGDNRNFKRMVPNDNTRQD